MKYDAYGHLATRTTRQLRREPRRERAAVSGRPRRTSERANVRRTKLTAA
jgi:hypothetical protein